MIVTHNMQQAARVSDRTAFFTAEVDPESDRRTGVLVEYDLHREDLLQPVRRADRELRHRPVRMTDDEAAQELPPRARRHPRRDRRARGASLVETIPRATQVLLDGDLPAPTSSSTTTRSIDERCFELEERCYAVLALQQPMASDLRRIIAAVKIIAEIERSADLCANICKAARRIYGNELDPSCAASSPR